MQDELSLFYVMNFTRQEKQVTQIIQSAGMENSRNTFFIAKTKRFDRSGLPVYALYLKDTNHHKMELVAGISRIRFSYTLFENGKIWIRKIITENNKAA